jgi:L-malate glycosyltransferase
MAGLKTQKRGPARILHLLGAGSILSTAPSRLVANLARHIDRERYELVVWFLVRGGPLVDELSAAGCRTRLVPWTSGPRQPHQALRFWRALRSESPAIVHQHFGGRTVRAVIRRATHAPVVVHLHSRIDEAHDNRPKRFSISDADAVVAVSHAVADGVGAASAQVIYPGVEVDAPHGSRLRVPFVIGTAGRLVELKGYGCLIEAMRPLMAEVSELQLEIAGDGPERAALERQAADLGLADRVRFLGWKPDIRSVMRNWDLYVQPSIEEGFGLAVLEAMATGLPVVATAVGGLMELVEHESTGWLVPPGDTQALERTLLNAMRGCEWLNEIGAAGRARAVHHFSADRMAAQIAAVYDRLLHDDAPRLGAIEEEA